jgi:acyl-CoA dehydrogenase
VTRVRLALLNFMAERWGAVTFDGFDLPDELRMMRDVARRFVAERLRPVEAEIGPEATRIPGDRLVGLREQARAAGLWCLDAPAEYGGGGLSAFQLVVVLEEACKHRFCFPHAGGGAFGHSPPVVLYQGGTDLIERYVKPAIEHGWTSYTAIAEESGGSDPARAIKTTARLVKGGGEAGGDEWVLTGRKMWITNADRARFGVVYARAPGGISAFVVDSGLPGLSVRPIPVIRDHWPTELVLDEVRVPAGNLVGAEGKGLALAANWLVRGRLTYAARAVGVAQEAVRIANDWVRERTTFGAPLATRQAVQWAIADSQVEIDAGRLLTWKAAWADDTGGDARLDAAKAKLYCTEMAFRVVDRMIQLLGAMGVARELPLEGWLRDLRVARLVEGSSEMLRSQIARQVIGPSVRSSGA